LFRPWFFSGWFFPGAEFRIRTGGKVLYLTFDDGPDERSTPLILDILERHNVKALFFCNGRNAEKFPGLISLLKTRGHLIGNHGYDHLNGWKTSSGKYCENVRTAAPHTSDKLFRPPFGRITPVQYRLLRNDYRIFFWDIMPYDFDKSLDAGRCFEILIKKIRPGSIIVLHDTSDSLSPEFLDNFLGYARDKTFKFVLPAEWNIIK
jgi:peptidoglycan-N-acetylglucosamine deacetylase